PRPLAGTCDTGYVSGRSVVSGARSGSPPGAVIRPSRVARRAARFDALWAVSVACRVGRAVRRGRARSRLAQAPGGAGGGGDTRSRCRGRGLRLLWRGGRLGGRRRGAGGPARAAPDVSAAAGQI